MTDPTVESNSRRQAVAGLCATCAHAQVVKSSRGSRFYLCRRSFDDAQFPRYPTLPVLTCPGYELGPEPPGNTS